MSPPEENFLITIIPTKFKIKKSKEILKSDFALLRTTTQIKTGVVDYKLKVKK
jgi:hypothetical protein